MRRVSILRFGESPCFSWINIPAGQGEGKVVAVTDWMRYPVDTDRSGIDHDRHLAAVDGQIDIMQITQRTEVLLHSFEDRQRLRHGAHFRESARRDPVYLRYIRACSRPGNREPRPAAGRARRRTRRCCDTPVGPGSPMPPPVHRPPRYPWFRPAGSRCGKTRICAAMDQEGGTRVPNTRCGPRNQVIW